MSEWRCCRCYNIQVRVRGTTVAAVSSVGRHHRLQESVTVLWVSILPQMTPNAHHVRFTLGRSQDLLSGETVIKPKFSDINFAKGGVWGGGTGCAPSQKIVGLFLLKCLPLPLIKSVYETTTASRCCVQWKCCKHFLEIKRNRSNSCTGVEEALKGYRHKLEVVGLSHCPYGRPSEGLTTTKASEPRGQRGHSPPQCWNRGGELSFCPRNNLPSLSAGL